MTLRTSIILDLKGNLANRARQSERAVDRLGRGGARSMSRLSRATNLAGRALDRLGNKYAALVTGAGAAATTRFLIQLEERFTQLGIQAGKSAEEIEKLKSEIFATARAPGIRVDPGQLTAAAEKIVEMTGDLDLFRANRERIAQAIGGAFARGTDIGALVADAAEKMGIQDPDAVGRALDTIIAQGKGGKFTLKKLSTQGTRLFAAFARSNRRGPEMAGELGALAQVAAQGSANAEQAATAFEAMFRTLNDAQKRKLIGRLGVRIMDPDDPKRMRNVVEVIKDIIRATEGDQVALGRIFDAEAIRAVTAAAADFQATGGFANSYDKFLQIVGDGTEIQEDAARAAGTMAASLRSISAALREYADRKLTDPLKAIADLLDAKDPKAVDRMLDGLTAGLAGLGGVLLARKFGFLRFGGGAGAAAAAGGAGLGGIAPQPVVVMNWPPGLMAGGGVIPAGRGGTVIGGGSVPAAGGGRLSRFARTRGVMRGAGLMALPLVGLQTIGALTDSGASTLDKFSSVGGSLGGFGGFAGGAKAGAMIGAFAGPIGIAIGGLLGGSIGALIGSNIGDAAGDALGRALGHRERAEVAVSFENAPPGTKVRKVDSSGGLFITTDMFRGPQMVTQP
ncbi:MAG: tail tape measure protein [bacterium]